MAGRKLQEDSSLPKRRQLPKLLACMTKQSLETMRNKALFSIDHLDAKGVRRRNKPLHECLILELKEAGYTESASYLQDLLYDNAQLVAEDDIGIVVDLRKKPDYLEHICSRLQVAERHRERGKADKECDVLLQLALYYAEKGKGILWLVEKFFLAAIAVSSRYLLDGGRLKGVCKYHYAKFLLDKFPGADKEEPYLVLTEVRDSSIGKPWLLDEEAVEVDGKPPISLFCATSIQLHRVLLDKSRSVRKKDPAKGERLARLAERRGTDANNAPLIAEAIIEVGICQLMMNNLNNAKKTFHRAFTVNTEINYIEGLCVVRMHLAAVMQRLGDQETAAKLLTEMGALAMEHNLVRQLGRALHLLGELHLRRERPELGTQHLTEAFSCFMGFYRAKGRKPKFAKEADSSENVATLGVIFDAPEGMKYTDEAEQSRLMTAVSAGQELMASYFALLRGARHCTIDTVKCIEWKLKRSGWWSNRPHHDLLACPCPAHKRTPLDVLLSQMHKAQNKVKVNETVMSIQKLPHNKSVDDFKKLLDEEKSDISTAHSKHSTSKHKHDTLDKSKSILEIISETKSQLILEKEEHERQVGEEALRQAEKEAEEAEKKAK